MESLTSRVSYKFHFWLRRNLKRCCNVNSKAVYRVTKMVKKLILSYSDSSYFLKTCCPFNDIEPLPEKIVLVCFT